MNAPVFVRTQAEEALVEHFDAFVEGDPMREARREAFEQFREHGLPHRRIEDWKYTDLRNLIKLAPPPAAPADPKLAAESVARSDIFGDLEKARFVFVNGHFVPALSDISGLEDVVQFHSMGRFLADGTATLDRPDFTDADTAPVFGLNTAFVQDGANIRIADGAQVDKPIEIVTLFCGDDPGMQTLRHQIVVGRDANVTFLQTYSGPDSVAYTTNVVAEIIVSDGAEVRWVKVQEEGNAAIHLGLILPRVGTNAVFDPFIFGAGSGVCRSEVRLTFDGEDSKSAMRGTTIARGRQHLDTTLIVEHILENCESREFFKFALDDSARAVFQGKITVLPEAQKTDGRMMSQALLLSEDAEFDNKPELEIFADDVQCAHGATCGQVDEEMLFFLRSRGIEREQAEQLLVQAFLAETIEQIGNEPIELVLEERTRRWLGIEGALR